MNRLAVAFLLLLASCARTGSDEPEPIFIGDFPDRALLAQCELLDVPVVGTATTLRSVGDTAFLVDFALDRETALLSQDLEVLSTVRYQAEGPLAVREVRDLALVDDTVILYADRPAQSLTRVSLGGRGMGKLRLGFPPESILPLGEEILVARTVLNRPTDPLLVVVDLAGRARPVPGEPVHLGDPLLQTLANLLILLPGSEGGAVGIHQFLSPFARLISAPDPTGRRAARVVALPVPGTVAERYGWLPERPFREDEILQILAPALAADVDRATGDFLVLTRSGTVDNGPSEKAVLRLDGEFFFRGAVRLPVNAGQLLYRATDRSLIVIDDLDRWHRCDAP
jgi:hypothetical protein